ncbi:MAG: T9SS type A sorting domain-containing protein [Fluviicola sp.]
MKNLFLFLTILLSFNVFSQTLPVYVANSGVTPGTGCVGIGSVVSENVQFTDTDAGESLELVVVSNNQGILPDGNIYDYTVSNSGGLFVFNIEANAISAGTVVLTLTVTGNDGLDITTTLTVNFINPTLPVFTPSSLTICSSTPVVYLNNYVDQTGGSWDFSLYEAIFPDGIMETSDFSLISGSTYTLSFSNFINGCVVNSSIDFIYYDGPSATITTSPITSCNANDGTAIAAIISPNGGDISSWSTGETNVSLISNLSPGNYMFYLEDGVGCNFEQAFVINSNGISDDDDDATITNVSCNGLSNGAISINSITGLTAPISYIWSSGHSTATVVNLAAGTYTAQATDVNGCQATFEYTITEPEALDVLYYSEPTDCGFSNGLIDVNTTIGGNGSYVYNWSNGMTGSSINGLPADVYVLTLTDALGCSLTETISITNYASSYFYGNTNDVTCGLNNGSINLESYIDPSTSLIGFQWSNGATTEDISGLSANTYWCKMFTADGCIQISNWELFTNQPQQQNICVVTVDSSTTTNLVVWEPEETVGISHYNIYRETTVIGEFIQIDTVQAANLSVFNDVVASPEERSWRYIISAVNTCGVESALSTPHRTIHLSMLGIGTSQTKVVWTPYEGANFSDYLIYRKESGVWTLIATVPNTQTEYLDNIDVNTLGLDYLVEFELATPCIPSLNKINDFNSSRSNRERGTFAVGEGTGDSNNELAENNMKNAKIYPNPFEDKLTIVTDVDQFFTAEIKDVNGKTIQEFSLNGTQNFIDLSSINSGYYFIILKNSNQTITHKITKL